MCSFCLAHFNMVTGRIDHGPRHNDAWLNLMDTNPEARAAHAAGIEAWNAWRMANGYPVFNDNEQEDGDAIAIHIEVHDIRESLVSVRCVAGFRCGVPPPRVGASLQIL